jgi:hypothetical protein
MKIRIFIIFFIFRSFLSIAQKENQILHYINACRTHPQEFLNNTLLNYLKVNSLLQSPFAKSLIKTLKNAKAIDSLYFTNDLTLMAKDCGKYIGTKGIVSHWKTAERFKKNNVQYESYGENLYFGEENALGIFMDLLIDEGEKDVGHRKNILDKNFCCIGISIQPHKKYGACCIIEFGGF